ncbi:CCA tRNA nucleotidyltransferase, mitochondrial [Tulasnella sp. 417]|nr:CCA tRNA nucleotidyltransferase, mitochondrial [Tulasnella sp. 417]
MSTRLRLADLTPPRKPRIVPPDSGGTLDIQLTPQEDRLCTLLDQFTNDLKEKRPDLSPVECRIAGGWVRDKLLGGDSNDIDIALSSMMGIAFAELFVPFIEERGLEVRNVTKIARNPEQSKHLETCKATLMGLEIDFVNLRSEEYAVDSRIPTKVEFGTPSQDAMRRDITVNALFYNVHTRSVEDYTGKGLDDLRKGVARTPLPPRETFLDDPLRVLRCIRFASRFGFGLDPSLKESVREKDVKDGLVSKISRDRVGEELDKMLKGRDPLHSLQLVEELGVHDEIFYLAPSAKPSGPLAPRKTSVIAATLIAALLSREFKSPLPELHEQLTSHAIADLGTRRRLYLAAALTPFRDVSCPEKKKTIPASEVVIREGVKLGNQNKYLSGVPLLLQAHTILSRPTEEALSNPEPRVATGLLLRDKHISNTLTEAHWSASALFCLVQDLVNLWNLESDTLDLAAASEVIELYNGLAKKVEELELEDAILAPPMLDGKEVCALLGMKPGVWMSNALAKVVEWQLGHPTGTKEECGEFIKEEVKGGRLVVGDVKKSSGEEGGKKKKAKGLI